MEKEKSFPVALPFIDTKVIFLGLGFLSFAVPFSLGNSQFVTGSVVNAALFLSVVFLPGRLFLPIIILPSLAVLSKGLIFGPLTSFLIYFLPIIWLGNLSLVLIFKKTFPSFGYSISVFFAALVKFLILFVFANLFFKFQLVPRLFLTAMGVNQLITAYLGGLLSFFFIKKICHERI